MRINLGYLEAIAREFLPKAVGLEVSENNADEYELRLRMGGRCSLATISNESLWKVRYDRHGALKLLEEHIDAALRALKEPPRPRFRIGLHSPKRLQYEASK